MKKCLIVVATLMVSLSAWGQNESPVTWSFAGNKKADKVYEVVLRATMSNPWHIYSQFTPEGGPIPTKITFTANPILLMEGPSKESGELITTHDDNFEVDVKYFSNQVEFVQTVKLRAIAKTDVRGVIEYMVCNDTKCLPPVKRPFEVKLQ